jgi:hypothetical protein
MEEYSMLQQGIMALPYNGLIDYDDALGVDMDQAAADIGYFIVPMKCELIITGAVITETCAGGTTTPEVDFDLRPTAGSDADRGAADLGHLVLDTTAAGKVMYDKAGRGTILLPGQEIVFELKVAATGTDKAGHVRPFILVKPLDETKANLTNMVETA